jgi:hypothetical protein
MAFFHCDYCGHQRPVAEEFLGRKARCPDCGRPGVIEPDIEPPFWRDRKFRMRLASAALSGCLAALGCWAYVSAWRTAPNSKSISAPAASATSDEKVARIVAETLTAASPPRAEEQSKQSPADAEAAAIVSEQERRIPDGWGFSFENNPPAPAEPEPAPIKPPAIPAKPQVKPVSVRVKKERPKIPAEELARQTAEGKELFEHVWKPNDKLAARGGGLGPVFNARSCVECHFQSGTGGSGTNSHNVQAFEVLPDREGGDVRDGVIHAFAAPTSHQETAAHLEQLLGHPKVQGREKGTNRLVSIDAVRTVFLNTPALWGNGLLDQISDDDLLHLENTRRLTGRYRRLANGQIGKFGWKAQIGTLHEFIGSACAAELGLSNSIRSRQKPHAYQDDPMAPPVLADEQVTAMVRFVAALPPPRQVLPSDDKKRTLAQKGHELFSSVGCANCHVETVAMAQNVFSDFRLHNVASSDIKSDKYYAPNVTPVYQPPPYVPQLTEWKTPPLWGLADTAPFWHDGSAPTFHDAILKHDQEAREVRTAYERLSLDQQDQLLSFLNTLKAPDVSP